MTAQHLTSRGRHEPNLELLDYLEQHNQAPKPFVWTADADLILQKVQKVCEGISNSGH